MSHPSINQISQAYAAKIGVESLELAHWHFCDNQYDADDCANLVASGDKRATCHSLWGLEQRNEPLPQVGELNIVTNWNGEAVCIIETTQVDILPLNEITAEHAFIEGEGDKSLEYWQKVHWDYYTRELTELGLAPKADMPVVFEQFKVVYLANESSSSQTPQQTALG